MHARADERLVEKALRLIAKAAVERPEVAARAEAELARWRVRSPANAAAASEAWQRWQMLGDLAPELRERFAPATSGNPSPRRRQMLALLLTGGGAGLLGGGAWLYRQQTAQFARQYSNDGFDTLLAELPDGPDGTLGSRLQLAPGTVLHTSFSHAARHVELAGGEAYFAVARDTDRPFRIDTSAGRIEVLGTAFNVAARGGVLEIAVEHGHVRFTPRAEGLARLPMFGPPAIDLRGGEALKVSNGRPEAIRPIRPEQVAAWRDGWLLFDDVPLADALPAINAYRRQPIVLADARTAALRLTGRFRAQDQRSLVQALPAILPLRAEVLDDGSIRLAAR